MTALSTVQVVQQVFTEANRGAFKTVTSGLVNPLNGSLATFRKDFPDVAFTVNTAVASGDLVGFHYTGTGTHAATGKRLSWTGSGVARVINSVVSEILSLVEDTIGRNIQLGIFPALGFGGVTGRWVGTSNGLMCAIDALQGESGSISGTMRLESVGKFTITGSRAGNALQITATGAGTVLRFSGTVSQGTINGILQGLEGSIRLVRL